MLQAPALTDILSAHVTLPSLLRVRRSQAEIGPGLDAAKATVDALSPFLAQIGKGASVAIAVGSRGISGIADVVKASVSCLHEHGAQPFIVPAMGSHGGASAEGQMAVLAHLGITPEAIDAPIRASMKTVALGRVDDVDVYVDREAARADHVLVINRIKSHTSFSGSVESGLAKMLAIGLGKQRGAEELHRLGPANLERRISAAARCVIEELPVLGGLALIEDCHKHLASVTFLPGQGIGGEREAELLVQAKSHEARLPFERIDVLIVDVMGKEISGTGMDTNVLGRRLVRGMPEPLGPEITNVVVLDVSGSSEGNAVGIGLADFAPAHAIARVDLMATYANALTAGLQGVQRAQLPIVLATDRDAIHAAVLTAALSDPAEARIVRIRNTLALDEMMVTPNLLDQSTVDLELVGRDQGSALVFEPDGTVGGWPTALGQLREST
jgi:hypothetical protein